MPKEDCKYWDKCYQKNDYHLQKYNHPEKEDKTNCTANISNFSPEKNRETVENEKQQHKEMPKRKSSTESNEKERAAETVVSANEQKDIAASDLATPGREEIEVAELRAEALSNIAGKDYMEILHKRIKLSVQKEYDELLCSNEFIRYKFLVEMPPDFYAFWKFACELKPDLNGEKLLDYFSKQYQLLLVGPFEFLAGRFHKATIHEPGDYLRHWRFYYDPPEFQTIFVRRGSGVHYGYWRDTPQDKNGLLIARNDLDKGCEFEFVGGNSFEAFLYFLEKDFPSSPFNVTLVANTKKVLQKFLDVNTLQLESLEKVRRPRNQKVVAKTFHRAGIVVPYEAKSQVGYRPLMVSDAELKRMLTLFEKAKADENDETVRKAVTEKLQPLATAASIALDEGDFGTSLELGIDLFCSGRPELHILAQSLLVPAYTLLKRPQFIAIAKAHMEKRSKENNLTIFDLEN